MEQSNIICFEVNTLEERAEAILLSLSYTLLNGLPDDHKDALLTGMNGYIFNICRAYLPESEDDRFKIWDLMKTHPSFEPVDNELEKEHNMSLTGNIYIIHIYHYHN